MKNMKTIKTIVVVILMMDASKFEHSSRLNWLVSSRGQNFYLCVKLVNRKWWRWNWQMNKRKTKSKDYRFDPFNGRGQNVSSFFEKHALSVLSVTHTRTHTVLNENEGVNECRTLCSTRFCKVCSVQDCSGKIGATMCPSLNQSKQRKSKLETKQETDQRGKNCFLTMSDMQNESLMAGRGK